MIDRLDQLALRARTGAWQGLRDAWLAFAAELDAELATRERALPLLRHRDRQRAQRIAQEHAAARALIEQIGQQIESRRPRAATFELLGELLRGRSDAADRAPAPDPLS